ncbi:MAG: PAS domain S-box protein [Rhizobiales bacterium]|nr:PAS domain S-box protein [Hyphomicrobiales bacterium]
MPSKPSPQRSLFESERSFRLLVEGVSDYAIFMLDPTGTVTSWNAGAERIKGYKASEIIGQHFSRFYSPEDRAAGMPTRSLETARRNGKFEAEGWRIRKDGSKFFASVVIDAIYENGDLIGFAKITRDITERQKAQAALAESENQFRMLLSGVVDYALYMLNPAGIVTNWNIGGQRIKGYAPEEIIGQHFSRFYTPADQAAGRPAHALQAAIDHGRYEEEGWRVRKDGTFFWASVVIDRITAADGRLLGFAKVTRDITERHEAQQRLERVQQQLAESQKFDALGQLTGGIAHDFNNLLMIISGHLHTLKRLAGDNVRAVRAVQAIETASQRGAALTNQLLTFARRQRVNPQAIELAERIHSVREVLDTGLGSNVHLTVEIEQNVWPVTVDVTEFDTALINLLINARDAMPNGGTVRVSAKNVRLDEDDRKGDHVAIAVEDSGVGIPQDVIARVFDPFFTTKAVGKGTGLGLSQVHGFAHQAGGTVTLQSELGQGSCFTILLPRGAAATSCRQNDGDDDKIGVSGTVLLVEDNPDVAGASAGLLEQLGYSVRWVSDAEAALKAIERDGIDLVLSDIVMPGKMDGLGLARAIRQKRPNLPVLLATGYSEAAQTARADFAILKKPYQIYDLSRALAEIAR